VCLVQARCKRRCGRRRGSCSDCRFDLTPAACACPVSPWLQAQLDEAGADARVVQARCCRRRCFASFALRPTLHLISILQLEAEIDGLKAQVLCAHRSPPAPRLSHAHCFCHALKHTRGSPASDAGWTGAGVEARACAACEGEGGAGRRVVDVGGEGGGAPRKESGGRGHVTAGYVYWSAKVAATAAAVSAAAIPHSVFAG
jgi:hypothetical protein